MSIGARAGNTQDGPFREAYPSNANQLKKGTWIHIESCNIPQPYGVRWEVRNHGLEAEVASKTPSATSTEVKEDANQIRSPLPPAQ